MKLAVIQHRLRDSAMSDALALAAAAEIAAGRGAELVVLPEVLALHREGTPERAEFERLMAEVPAACLIPHVGVETAGLAFVATLPGADALAAQLGRIALLVGDACADAVEIARLAAETPAMAVLVPRSENELQAEATLELAIALSDSMAGLVLIAECAGGEPGEPGHGGSAIVLLGDVLAEAIAEDDVLIAEVPVPLPQPEPREALPELAPILVQRLARHQGRKVGLPGDYLPDLS